MLRLDKRLKEILAAIPYGSYIVDIGTDHGKIPVSSILKGISIKAIATDISAKSLEKSRILVNKYGLSDKIELRLGDGLDIINPNEADTLIISGMGAQEIISIIDRSDIIFNTYIFTPHQETVKLREYLTSNKYEIISDRKVKAENKFYDIIICKSGIRELSYRELMLGISNDYSNKDFIDFIDYEVLRVNKLLGFVPENTDNHNKLERYYTLLKEVSNGKS